MPIRSLVFLLLIFSSCNSDMDDELVVDYLDMSANDFSVQVSYSSDIEIFQNESHETCISTHCFIGRRVLPKNGSIEIDKSKIVYAPNENFYGLDSISYEVCCDKICNVYTTRFRIWRDNEERCLFHFSEEPEIFRYEYSYGEIINSNNVRVGIMPNPYCKNFIQSFEIIKNPVFGSLMIGADKSLTYEGQLPPHSSDTIIYVLNLSFDSEDFSKKRLWVIARDN